MLITGNWSLKRKMRRIGGAGGGGGVELRRTLHDRHLQAGNIIINADQRTSSSNAPNEAVYEDWKCFRKAIGVYRCGRSTWVSSTGDNPGNRST